MADSLAYFWYSGNGIGIICREELCIYDTVFEHAALQHGSDASLTTRLTLSTRVDAHLGELDVSTNLSSLIPTEVPTLLTRAETTIGECAALPGLRPSRSDSTVAIEERFEQVAAGFPLGDPCGFFFYQRKPRT